MLSPQKRDALIESIPGIVLGDVTAIESANAATSKKIDDEGISRKETSLIDEILNPEPEEEVPAVEETVEEEVPAPKVVEEEAVTEEEADAEPVEEEAPAPKVEAEEEAPAEEEVSPEDGKSVPAFSKEQAAELKDVFEAFSVSLVSQIEKSFNKAVSAVTEAREKETEEIIQETPAVSLRHILGFGDPTVKSMSATRSDETIVDGRKSLARSKPQNGSEEKGNPVNSGDPIINDIAEGIFNFKELMIEEQPVE